ncbi:MAG: universal stress protein [Ilumatobacter sp.]|nr:universal stress protein [Ilumatobacter sp.]
MTRDLIVGIDGSDVAQDALRWTLRNTPDPAATVVAMAVWRVPLAMRLLMAKRSFDVDRLGLAAEAHHTLDVALAATADEDGVGAVEPLVVEGSAGAELLTRAHDADLLVLGRQGDSDLQHRLLGSVSRHCATRAPVPTVVVPPGFDRPRATSVIVGFDGSDNASAALRWALDFFDDSVAIELVAAVDLSPWLDVESTIERFPEQVETERQRLLTAAGRVDPDGRAVRTVVLHGPKQALAEACAEADVVVLGARGHGALGAALLGSVATWMLEQSPCPVAIVPADD